jgi:hypothetical protein
MGKHVLAELALRAYRYDPLPLDEVSEEMGGALRELDDVAKTAQYFLSELGPVTPPETLPYMRISAAGLANRRTSVEDLAEVFRNTWGMVEVIESDARDRLLAAELLVQSPVPASRLYAPIMHTMEMLRSSGGTVRTPAGTAAILHLFPAPTPEARMAEWKRWRPLVRSDETAALLAGRLSADQSSRLDTLRASLQAAGASPSDAEHAAAYLLLAEHDPTLSVGRTIELAERFKGRLPSPFTASVLLVTRHRLSTAELADWVEKATGIAAARRLAPTPPELFAIAVALVHGILPDRFRAGGPAASGPRGESVADVLSLVALHAWMYRPILEPARKPNEPTHGTGTPAGVR